MISASEVTKRHELIMSLVAGLSPIIKVWKTNAQLNNGGNPCRDGTGFFLFWAARQDFTRIYGQTGIFGAFVRNRHFLSRPITDKEPIFIDVSVNDN